MESNQIRKRLHDYIDTADSVVLEAMYTILKNQIEGDQYSVEFINEVHNRRRQYLENPTQSFTVEESLALIRRGKNIS